MIYDAAATVLLRRTVRSLCLVELKLWISLREDHAGGDTNTDQPVGQYVGQIFLKEVDSSLSVCLFTNSASLRRDFGTSVQI